MKALNYIELKQWYHDRGLHPHARKMPGDFEVIEMRITMDVTQLFGFVGGLLYREFKDGFKGGLVFFSQLDTPGGEIETRFLQLLAAQGKELGLCAYLFDSNEMVDAEVYLLLGFMCRWDGYFVPEHADYFFIFDHHEYLYIVQKNRISDDFLETMNIFDKSGRKLPPGTNF